MSWVRYFVKKTVITIFLIFLVTSAIFVLFRLMPGNFTDKLLLAGADPSSVAAIKQKFGLDEPIYVQYVRYVSNLLRGDMGTSFQFGQPVWQVVRPRIFFSAILVAPAVITAYILGSIYGAVLGVNREKAIDKYGTIPVILVGATPEFLLGIFLVLLLAVGLDLFPASGVVSSDNYGLLGGSPLPIFLTTDFWWHFTLPYLTIVLRFLWGPSLIMRTSVVEVAGQDFINYHRISGLPGRRQMRHIMKHASIPVITLFPVTMARALSGMVLVEIVFNWPGIGSLLIDSVLSQDFPVVQFVFFIVAIWVIIGNYVVDLLYPIIDPRVTIADTEGS